MRKYRRSWNMSKRNKPNPSPKKPVEKTDKEDADELTDQDLDKISGGPLNPPYYGYIGETEKN
jgi:hypothetical protein